MDRARSSRRRRPVNSVFRVKVLALVALAVSVVATAADPQTPLDKYLAGMKTLRSEFTQTVTDGRGEQVQQANGKLVIVRPGRFRWELTPAGNPNAQLMIADAKNLWFYDPDLEQVSVKPASVLTATPASLLSGAGDIRTLFTVTTAGKRDGFDWVKVVPKQGDADFREAQLGFGSNELKRMVLKDKLGQTVRLDFTASQRNAPVDEAEVTFVPPAGADVIGTPVQ
jgi:outer membrane lipoprotein carrier protein